MPGQSTLTSVTAVALPSYADLQKMTDAELADRYNRLTSHHSLGPEFYVAELDRRRIDRQTATIRRLTWVVTAATVLSTISAAISAWAVLH